MNFELSRRAFLVSAAAAASAFAAIPGTCVLTPEETEGPYYIDGGMVRKNLAEDRKGVPLQLRIKVANYLDCAPVNNAAVDVWHCDAGGEYSGYGSMPGPVGPRGGRPPMGPPPPAMDGDLGPGGPPPKMAPTNRKKFLRGIQHTDNAGTAEFLTIYPGWYEGRCIHIHLKVHTDGHVAHTGQLYFPEDLSDSICELDPYSRHRGQRLLQADDGVFQSQNGRSSMVEVRQVRANSLQGGLIATVLVGVDPRARPTPVRGGGAMNPFGHK